LVVLSRTSLAPQGGRPRRCAWLDHLSRVWAARSLALCLGRRHHGAPERVAGTGGPSGGDPRPGDPVQPSGAPRSTCTGRRWTGTRGPQPIVLLVVDGRAPGVARAPTRLESVAISAIGGMSANLSPRGRPGAPSAPPRGARLASWWVPTMPSAGSPKATRIAIAGRLGELVEAALRCDERRLAERLYRGAIERLSRARSRTSRLRRVTAAGSAAASTPASSCGRHSTCSRASGPRRSRRPPSAIRSPRRARPQAHRRDPRRADPAGDSDRAAGPPRPPARRSEPGAAYSPAQGVREARHRLGQSALTSPAAGRARRPGVGSTAAHARPAQVTGWW